MNHRDPTRRRFLEATLATGAAVVLGRAVSPLLASEGSSASTGGAKLVGTVPFVGEGDPPLGTAFGAGLGGRKALDLSTLTQETLVTPSEQFFVRTRVPGLLDTSRPWEVRVGGLVEQVLNLPVAELRALSKSQGVHLMECAGNGPHRRFGLMSAAAWDGVPVAEILERVTKRPRAALVRIEGFDQHSQLTIGSQLGASWTFTFEQLESSGAFLATAMNEDQERFVARQNAHLALVGRQDDGVRRHLNRHLLGRHQLDGQGLAHTSVFAFSRASSSVPTM